MSTADRPQQREGEDYWAYYNRRHHWEVEHGQWCYRCGRMAALFPRGHRELCSECKALDADAGEVDSGKFVRCPSCRAQHDVFETGLFSDCGLGEEGPNDVTCGSCGHEFVVDTHIAYSWTSPPLLTEGAGEAAAEDDDDDDDDE